MLVKGNDTTILHRGLIAIAAFLAVLGIQLYFSIGHIPSNYLPNHQVTGIVEASIIGIVLFIGFCKIWDKLLPKLNVKLSIMSFLIAVIFSMCLVFGRQLQILGHTEIIRIKTWVAIVGIASCLIPLLVPFIGTSKERLADIFSINFTCWENLKTKYSWIKKYEAIWVMSLILLSWTPILLALYPGMSGYDSVYQYGFYQSGSISLHHPLLHTYFIGFLVLTLGEIFGSYAIGLLIHSIVQMMILAGMFTAIYVKLKKMNVVSGARYLFLMFVMLFPLNGLLAISVTKDIIFTVGLALVVLNLAVFSLVSGNVTNVFWIETFFYMFICATFRNQGIYVIYVVLLVWIIVFRKFWKNILILGVIFIGTIKLFNGPVTTALSGVPTNSIREMVSVPVMQLSRVYHFGKNISEKDKDMIMKYIPGVKSYVELTGISDSMKNTFNEQRLKEDSAEFIQLYQKMAVQYPKLYLDAFLRLSIGLWYPDMVYRDVHAWHPFWEVTSTEKRDNWITIPQKSILGFSWLANFFDRITYTDVLYQIPLVGVLFSSGIHVWLFIAMIGRMIYFKNRELLLPIIAVLTLIGTLLLGPVVLYRYIYPVMVCNMILLMCLFRKDGYIDDFDNGI